MKKEDLEVRLEGRVRLWAEDADGIWTGVYQEVSCDYWALTLEGVQKFVESVHNSSVVEKVRLHREAVLDVPQFPTVTQVVLGYQVILPEPTYLVPEFSSDERYVSHKGWEFRSSGTIHVNELSTSLNKG